MQQELIAEVAAPCAAVWAALRRELSGGGAHVTVVEERSPEVLRLQIHSRAGELLDVSYQLAALDEEQTAVTATIAVSGVRYAVERLVTFGAIDRNHLDTLAIGLANLQAHFAQTES